MADIIITEAENGNTLQLHVGDTVTVRLPEKSAAGYQWTPNQIDTNKVTHTKLHDTGAPQRIGGKHMCLSQFIAKAPGTVPIQLKHWRPWEGDSSIIARYSVTFDIQP